MHYLLIIVLILMNSRVSFAAPGPITGRLMNEPLSMLDYGLWRTELELKRFFNNIDNIFVGATYNWNKDQILIQVILYETPETLKDLTPDKQCRHVIKSIRDFYGIDTSTGRPAASMENTLLGKSFVHNGFAGSDIPQAELFSQLDKMTYINVSMMQQNNIKDSENKTAHSNAIACSAGLLGKVKKHKN